MYVFQALAVCLIFLARLLGTFSRSAAEQSLTAWRSLGDAGRAGAAASLLSLGHLVLQLHGVGAGIEEARCGFFCGISFESESNGPVAVYGVVRHTCWDVLSVPYCGLR